MPIVNPDAILCISKKLSNDPSFMDPIIKKPAKKNDDHQSIQQGDDTGKRVGTPQLIMQILQVIRCVPFLTRAQCTAAKKDRIDHIEADCSRYQNAFLDLWLL